MLIESLSILHSMTGIIKIDISEKVLHVSMGINCCLFAWGSLFDMFCISTIQKARYVESSNDINLYNGTCIFVPMPLSVIIRIFVV
jgi:hypothetical protein